MQWGNGVDLPNRNIKKSTDWNPGYSQPWLSRPLHGNENVVFTSRQWTIKSNSSLLN
jgi:hypothetical protein